MCSFFSAIIKKNGDMVEYSEYTDSHEDLISAAKLRDDGVGQDFVRIKLLPPDKLKGIEDVKNWEFKVDQSDTPNWWNDLVEKSEAKVRRRVKRMLIIDEERDILVGGCHILINSKINNFIGGRIAWLLGESTIKDVRGNATIKDVRDNATINNVRGNATINDVMGNATINNVRGNATIKNVWGNATIKNVWDNATIKNVRDNATINDVRGNATIKNVRGNATINNDQR